MHPDVLTAAPATTPQQPLAFTPKPAGPAAPPPPPPSDQPSAESFLSKPTKWKASDPRQVQLNNALAGFIATDLLPLYIVESASFRQLMEKAAPNFSMPSRKHLSSNLLPSVCYSVETQLKMQMRQAQDICLTVDIWSSCDMRSFMGITGHFILDYTMHSVMLACRRFTGSHTGEKTLEQFQETLVHFNISEKFTHVITDNAANMVKAFTLPGMEALAEQPDEDEVQDEDDITVVSTEELDYLPPQRSPCFAHTLQLVVKDGLEQAGSLKQVIAKVSKLVSHCRKSTISNELLEGHTKLQLANATRWNSQLTMLQSLLRIPADVLAKIQDNASISLTAYELKLISELVEILQPFQIATDLVQGDKVVTASFVISTVKGLRATLADLRATYNSKLVATLQSSLEKRLAQFEDTEHFKFAVMLDPRFKLDWCSNEEHQTMKDLLTSKYKALAPDSTPADECQPPPVKRSKLFSFMNTRAPTPATQQPENTEVSTYLSLPCIGDDEDPLAFWKQQKDTMPVLSTLACKYLCIPASSAPVERIFSVAGKVFRPERCHLSDTRFQELMFVHCNSK